MHLNFNPFLSNAPILYPLKTPENLWYNIDQKWVNSMKKARNQLFTPRYKSANQCKFMQMVQ